jgi:F0F1-type ATP synthase assembly protein I
MAEDHGQPEKPQLPSDDDIQARFEKIREDLRGMELPELPEDADLRAKIDHVTNPSGPSRMPDVPELVVNRPKKASTNGTPGSYNYRGLGIGMSAAYSLVGSMIVGFGIGWAYDKATHSSYGQPIGAMLGAIFGIVAAMWLINHEGGNKK